MKTNSGLSGGSQVRVGSAKPSAGGSGVREEGLASVQAVPI